MPTQLAAAWGKVVTPGRGLQLGCWKAPWMTLMVLVDGVVLTEPHQLALVAVGLARRILDDLPGGGRGGGPMPPWPIRLRPNSNGTILISDCGIRTPFREASTVKASSARAWWATRAEPRSVARVHRMVRRKGDRGGRLIYEVV